MGQFKSSNENNLVNRLVKIEQDIINLKAIQQYNPEQINYTYQSNSIKLDGYRSSSTEHYKILASFIFTSWFPDILPRINFQCSEDGVLDDIRTEYVSKNQIRVVVYFIDDIIPLSPPKQFSVLCFVKSNVSGVLKLENTYVL